jgi:hypothetical protein
MAKTSPPRPRIPWHPAFVQALQLELEPYLDSLQFLSEVQLTSEPLRVDVVIIKKSPSLPIEKNIARRFKEVNILEYKSPADYLSIHDFHKTLGYALLYAFLHKVSMNDMTVSLISSRHPRKLFKRLREEGCGVEELERGIYGVGGYPLPVQVIESGKLGTRENLWLRNLKPGLNTDVLSAILDESDKRAGAGREAYLDAVFRANLKTPEEVEEIMKKKRQTFEDLLEEVGLAAKWEARGEANGEKTAWEKAITLLKQGYTVEQLERMDPIGFSSPAKA